MPVFVSLLSAMAWGVQALFVKISLAKADLRQVVFLTLLINCLIVFLWMAFSGRLSFLSKGWNDSTFIHFMIAGALNYFLGRWLYYDSIRMIGPTKATAISSSYPIASLLFAFFLLEERLSTKRYLGIGLTLLGVYLLFARRRG